jgi:hypothetical protein
MLTRLTIHQWYADAVASGQVMAGHTAQDHSLA